MEVRVPITFTVEELWLLHAFVRHECEDAGRWRWPPADQELNEEIALALAACYEDRLDEYTLLLSRHQLLVIDYWIRRDHKDAYGRPLGESILLKTFAARRRLALGPDAQEEPTYKEVMRDANPGAH